MIRVASSDWLQCPSVLDGARVSGRSGRALVFKTWDLNFGAWIFTLAVSKTETWKLLGRDFQNLGSQLWDLDFTKGLHSGLRPWAPTSSNICEN